MILILGGTTEARELAAALHDAGVEVTSSLAGRVGRPRLPAGRTRIGGFGGPEALAAWIAEHGVAAVIDATHPFAERISASAAKACPRAGVALLRLERPGWSERPGDRWQWVDDLDEAAAAIGSHRPGAPPDGDARPPRGAPARDAPGRDVPPRDAPPRDVPPHDALARDVPPRDALARDAPPHDAPARDAPPHGALARDVLPSGDGRDLAVGSQRDSDGPPRVFLTTGRQGLAAFADVGAAWFLVRCVDPPEPPLPRHHEVLLDRGPYTLAGELALVDAYAIDLVVTKDSGGEHTVAKLDAARERGLPVIVVRRPPRLDVPTARTVGEALEWAAALRR